MDILNLLLFIALCIWTLFSLLGYYSIFTTCREMMENNPDDEVIIHWKTPSIILDIIAVILWIYFCIYFCVLFLRWLF
jgi:hypothetical protein